MTWLLVGIVIVVICALFGGLVYAVALTLKAKDE
jgi:hypothetical protein